MTGRSGARTRVGGIGLALGLALLLCACRVDATTSVQVAEDGSGTVTVEVVLDQAAADRIPDLAEQLRVDDLTQTGWEVVGPEPAEGGGVVITATKAFFEPEQLGAVLAEVGARRGPIQDASLVRERSFGRTTYDFEAILNLAQGIQTFGDRQLTELLDGFPVGRDLEALEAQLGVPIEETMSFTFEIALPEGDEVQTSSWTLALGEGPTPVAASTAEVNWLAYGLAAAAAVAVLLLMVVLIVRLLRRGRSVSHRS